jgi:hypothetical protein
MTLKQSIDRICQPKNWLNSCACLILLAVLLFHASLSIAGDSKNYVPWPMDEYEFFGLSKDALAKQYKGKLIFNDDQTRAKLDPSGQGQFLFTFANGKVAAVQRLTLGPSGREYYGPMLKSKESAIEFARTGLALSPKSIDGDDSAHKLAEKRFKALSKMLKRSK